MAKQIPMPPALRRHLEAKFIGTEIVGLIVKKVLGRGNTAITYEAEDQYGVPWALKLVTRHSYGERAPFREVARFARTLDDRFLVFPKETGDWQYTLAGSTTEFLWFKSRCVRGQSLEAFLSSEKSFSAKTEILRYMQNLSAGLEELWRLGFAHGDLHGRNIMREVIGDTGPMPEVRYVIIDFSEAHPVAEPQGGLLNDLESFGAHLRSFADSLYQRIDISREDEKILRAMEHLPGLVEGTTAEGIGITRPADVLKRFESALRSAEEAPRKLLSPFDSLSAENITNDALLAELCFTRSWWTGELEKPENVLLVGPRGCGKSMIFRRMRLRTKISAKKIEEIRSDHYVGFYIPCESLFFNRISDLTDETVERYRDALILFFNMGVLAEVSTTLGILPDFLGPVGPSAIAAICELAQEECGDLWDSLDLPHMMTEIAEMSDYSERVMRFVRRRIANGEGVLNAGSTDFLVRLVSILRREISPLSARLFMFFLDDYTEERVPLSLQRALHPIVCQRSGELCFKISAHMFGSIYSFPQPLALDEGRNILIINLGSWYLNRDRKKAEGAALVKIMNERFARCEGYGGRIEEWLGKTSFPGGRSLNRALHDSETREKVKYHGIECLLDLCTGDISEMIRMVGEIFREARIGPGSPVRVIDPSIQDKAIRNISREFLSRIRHVRPDGHKLFEVVNAFGELSASLLYEREEVGQGKSKRGVQRRDPYDLLTLYVDDLPRASETTRRVWERLQKASVFVDIRLAPSQREVIADRATLRRIYCPAFGTMLSSSEHLQMTKEQFEWFIGNPVEFCRDYLRKVLKQGQGLNLWDSQSKPSTEQQLTESEGPVFLPAVRDRFDCTTKAPEKLKSVTRELKGLQAIDTVIARGSEFDWYIGAMGYEERTTSAAAALVRLGVRAKLAFLLEFDMYYKATAKRRPLYETLITQLTDGKPYRPLNSPVGNPDPSFVERMKYALKSELATRKPRVLFDCTSCPSLVLSKCIRLLLEDSCDLTVLYSEAALYYPTREEWESGKVKPRGSRVEGPFSGVRFVEKPPSLQSDDTGERPVLLVLFPTFNTERTSGVLADLDPARRIWLVGEPHNVTANAYRMEMAKSFTGPVMYPGDPWSVITTFDYRATMTALGGIYSTNRFNYRIVVMPHGSKMQTLGVNLFAAAHDVSLVFAMPKTYKPDRYSDGCIGVWAIQLGDTEQLMALLRGGRVVGEFPAM